MFPAGQVLGSAARSRRLWGQALPQPQGLGGSRPHPGALGPLPSWASVSGTLGGKKKVYEFKAKKGLKISDGYLRGLSFYLWEGQRGLGWEAPQGPWWSGLVGAGRRARTSSAAGKGGAFSCKGRGGAGEAVAG